MNPYGGDQSGSKEAWQQGAPPANLDSTGGRQNSSHRAAGAAKEHWQQGGHYGNSGSGKRSNPNRPVQTGWVDGSSPGGSHGPKGAPQQGVQPLPFIGYANERPAGSRGHKTKKSNGYSTPAEQAVPTVFAQSSRAVSFNLNAPPGTGYPPGVAPQLPAKGSAANRGKTSARDPAHGSQNAVVEIDPQLLKSANEMYHEYFLQQLSRGTDSAQSRPRHPSNGLSGARQPLPETKPSEYGGSEAEQMSQDIADPFQLLAALWSMVPAVEDPKGKKPVGMPPAGANVTGEHRPTSVFSYQDDGRAVIHFDDRFKDMPMPQPEGIRRYEVHGGSRNAVEKAKASSSNDTK